MLYCCITTNCHNGHRRSAYVAALSDCNKSVNSPKYLSSTTSDRAEEEEQQQLTVGEVQHQALCFFLVWNRYLQATAFILKLVKTFSMLSFSPLKYSLPKMSKHIWAHGTSLGCACWLSFHKQVSSTCLLGLILLLCIPTRVFAFTGINLLPIYTGAKGESDLPNPCSSEWSRQPPCKEILCLLFKLQLAGREWITCTGVSGIFMISTEGWRHCLLRGKKTLEKNCT